MLLREKQVPHKPFPESHSAAISADGVISEKNEAGLGAWPAVALPVDAMALSVEVPSLCSF